MASFPTKVFLVKFGTNQKYMKKCLRLLNPSINKGSYKDEYSPGQTGNW